MDKFWETKTLSEMTQEEWESLCDHCGKCCLVKLEDDDEAQSVYYTNVACNLLDIKHGQCTDYANRQKRVPSCLRLTKDNLEQIHSLPLSCSYRRVYEGQGLAEWHHLITNNVATIHDLGYSVIGKVVSENDVDDENLEEHIVEWPLHL